MKYLSQQFICFITVLFLLPLAVSGAKLIANDTLSVVPPNIPADTVLLLAEKMPEFPGGLDSLASFIKSEIHYPEDAASKGIGGKVYIQFVVNKEGKVVNSKVLKGIGGGCDEEAIRIVNILPKWNPGVNEGKVVCVLYTLPINFKMPSKGLLTAEDQMPEFPGGNEALKEFLANNIRYPVKALNKGITGKVNLKFMVGIKGEITNIKVLDSIGGGCEEEAIRLVKSMPQWKPGKKDGKPVSSYYTMPFVFNLRNSESGKTIDFIEPQFPGGNDSLAQFLSRNFKYPKDAEDKGLGGSVYVHMKVDKEGKISDPKVSMGVCASIDTEALRIVRLFPSLIPAKQKGKSVKMPNYSLQFNFDPHNSFENDSLAELKGDDPLTFVEEMPQFPGGIDAMLRYLGYNIKYPEIALQMGIKGKVVLQFIVDKNGEIRNVKVVRSLGGGCDEEAIRIVKSMPRWKPGRLNGKDVPVYFTLPVIFKFKE